jgi:photosystem II stability/assembly factor-like uncharacterized protein
LTLFRRAAAAALAAVALLAVSASAAQAMPWTALDSTTAEEISAVEYHPDGRIWFATTGGKLYRRPAGGGPFTQEAAVAATFSDIAFNSTGTVGLATADTGKLYRSDNGGDTWSLVALSSYDHECPGSGPNPSAPVNGNLLAVQWSSDTMAWIVSDQRGQILKSTNSGGSWSDASRALDGSCKIDAFVTDVAPVAGSVNDVYFVDKNFATVWRTSDALTSSAAERTNFVNCFGITMKLAVDPASSNRLGAAGPCTGTLHWGFSSDSASNSDYVLGSGTARIRDLDAGPGVFLAVGDAGLIEQSLDGTRAYPQPAGGVLATRDWRSVDFADASRAAVAGVGGALAITDQANVPPPPPVVPGPPTSTPTPTPDVRPPTVGRPTIGSGTLTPGQGTTFGFNASEAGLAVLTFEKRFDGLKSKRKGKNVCVPRTKKRLGALRKQAGSKGAYRTLLRKKACKGYQRIGAIRQQARSGRNTIAFNGRVAGRKLTKGNYRAKLAITDAAGNVSRAETIKFKVVKKKR